MRRLLAAVLVAGALALPAQATTPDEDWVDKNADIIEAMAREFSRIAQDKDPDGATDLLPDLKKYEDSLKALLRASTSDDRYKTNAERITDYVRIEMKNVTSLRAAIEVLARMEAAQTGLDGLPGNCEKLQAQVEDTVGDMILIVDEDDLDAIEDLITPVQTSINDTFDQARDARDDLKSLAAKVKSQRFEDQRLYDKTAILFLRRYLDRAADEIYTYYDRALDRAERDCAGLVDLDRNAVVLAAMKRAEAELAAVTAFVRAGESWFARARDAWRLNCGAREEIAVAHCSFDSGTPGGEADSSDVAAANRIADMLADQSILRVQVVLREFDTLEREGERLLDETDSKTVESLLNAMRKYKFGLQDYWRAPQLMGGRKPWDQVWQTYGRDMHDRLASVYRCDVYDKPISSSNRTRPDCVIFADPCVILEFKPEGTENASKGRRQLAGYQNALEDHLTDALRDLLKDHSLDQIIAGEAKPPSSTYGGQDVFIKGQACIDGDRFVFENTVLDAYKRCSNDPEYAICDPAPSTDWN